jgi:hypothetical protein
MTVASSTSTHAVLSNTEVKLRPPSSKPWMLPRIWRTLHEVGKRRAVAELGWYVQLHGGRPTGDLEQDAQQLAVLRGLR